MKKHNHAIVIGGSIAGLLTARVLSNHFQKITILDRDDFPEEPAFRAGTPQSHHLHLLLIRGKQILDQLFPGFSAELIQNGAPQFDAGNDVMTVTPFGPVINAPTTLQFISSSRSFLEWHIRQRVAQLPGITIQPKTTVSGYIFNEDKTRIRGVQLRPPKNHTGCAGLQLQSDLVIDASGRNSQATKWLSQHGYPAPPTTIVNSHLTYATRWYKAPPSQPPQLNRHKAIMVNVRPPNNPRIGALLPIEGGYWPITLAGMAGVAAPTDEAGFLAFAQKLSTPIIAQIIPQLEPASPIHGFGNIANTWKHYEKMAQLPAGWATIGDAACAFNPIYGQGMTIAALSALALDKTLHTSTTLNHNFTRTLHRRLARIYAIPWQLATGEDFRWPQTEGKRPGKITRIRHWYADQVLKLMSENLQARITFLHAVHLLKSPLSMMKPTILLQVLKKGLTS